MTVFPTHLNNIFLKSFRLLPNLMRNCDVWEAHITFANNENNAKSYVLSDPLLLFRSNISNDHPFNNLWNIIFTKKNPDVNNQNSLINQDFEIKDEDNDDDDNNNNNTEDQPMCKICQVFLNLFILFNYVYY